MARCLRQVRRVTASVSSWTEKDQFTSGRDARPSHKHWKLPLELSFTVEFYSTLFAAVNHCAASPSISTWEAQSVSTSSRGSSSTLSWTATITSAGWLVLFLTRPTQEPQGTGKLSRCFQVRAVFLRRVSYEEKSSQHGVTSLSTPQHRHGTVTAVGQGFLCVVSPSVGNVDRQMVWVG